MANQSDINIRVQVDTSQAEKSTINYRQRVRELKDEMTTLQLAGKENTAEYAAAAAELGKITDAMSDTSAQARILSDDFFKQRAAMEGLSLGANVFSQLTQAAELCGIENENLSKALNHLQGVMNLANSAMNISKALNKDSALMIALRMKNTKALTDAQKANNITTEAGAVATNTLTAAEKTATTAAGQLTVGCKAVGTAIKAIPIIGWITTAIGLLGTLKDLISGYLDEEERGIEIRKEQIKLLDEQQSKMRKVYTAVSEEEKHFNYIVARLKEVKKGTSEWEDLMSEVSSITRISKDYLEEHPNVVARVLDQQHKLNKAQQEYNTYQELIQEHEEEARKASDAWLHGHDKDEKESARKRFGFLDDLAKSEKRLAESADADIKNYKRSLYAYMDIAKNWTKVQEEKEQAEKDAADAADKALEKEQTTATTSKEEITAATKLRRKAREQELQEEIDRTEEGTEARVEAEWNLLEYKKNIAKQEVAMQEGYNRLSTEEKQALVREAESKYLEEQSKLWNDYRAEQNQKEIDDYRKTKDEELNIDKIVADTRLIGLKEGSKEYNEALKEQYAAETAIALEALRRQNEDKEISDDEYNALRIQKEVELQNKLAEIDAENKKLVDNSVQHEIQKYAELVQQKLQIVQTFINTFSDLTTAMMEAELSKVEGNSRHEADIRKKYAKMQFAMQIGQIGVSTAASIAEAWSSVAGIIFPGNVIAGGILTAMLTATGIAQTVKAKQEMNKTLSGKAARGAFIKGKSHSQGGELWELEGGEAVLNKKAMAIPAFRQLASAMNEATGGVSFSSKTMQSSSPVLAASVSEEAITKIVAGITAIPVVVTENDITTAQRNVSVIEQRSRF